MTRGTVGRVGDAGEREGSVRRRGERGDPRPSRRSRSGAWGAAAGRGAVLGGLAGIAASLAFTAYYIVRRHYLPGDIPFIGLHLLTYPLWRVAPVAMVCGASVGVVLRAAGPWRRPVASACFAAAAAGAAFVVARRYGVPLPPTIRLPVTGFAAAVGIIAGAPFLLLFARIDRAVAAVRWNAVGLAVAGPLAVLSLIALAGHPTTRLVPHQRFSEERFLELFDRHAPGMEEVFRLAGRGDRAGAIHALAEHFRTRPVPPMRPGIEVGPATDAQLEIADAALAHRYRMTGFERQEGKKIDWTGSQVQDAEWAYTLNRHTQWVEMARAWRRTGDPKYVREVVTLLHDWTARTEPLRWKDEMSPHWRLVESGLRMRNAWMQTSEALRDRPELDDRFWVDYLGSVNDQEQFLAHFRGDANHLLIEINGLLETALHYPEFRRSGKWLDIALGRLQQQVRAQVYDDGVNVELSPAYHRLVLEELMLARAAILSHGMMLPGDLDERIEAMWEYLASVVQPDGIVPSLNDGAVAKVDDDLVRVGALFDRPDFIYAGTGGREGTRPRWSSRCFPQAGQVVMRTGWTPEDLELTFDAGAFGGPHGHEDKLSVTCWGYGRPLIVDNGSYTYDPANRFHRYFRATAGHNLSLIHISEPTRQRCVSR
ncbi:MAG: heparinase II/III family protein, partial [Candidatus Eisenbacteria bacterium]|nr:heparinase II/III family protein [Candidatus Eisenbacteria bacterium]